ncbi:MAG: DUF3575 domain-containing protein [Weeksellaceae bacterium]|jgi:hypothetical protein|nr:DUF3575 domain-containing protein [Weeksellaceae bacterium]QIY83485.1 DUF3575 domain-containing protein [Chryseobacterium sp. NEB161]
MKRLFLLGFSSIAASLFAQKNDTYIKANALFLPIGMINVAVEHGFTDHITGQAELFVSPWKSFAGHNALLGIASAEGRYYFDEAFKHWYVGASLGFSVFNLHKWNYWNDNFYVHKDGTVTPYISSNLYEKGYSFILGGVGGYQFQVNDRWNIDVYLGVGTVQSFYKGYDKISGDRYDTEGDSMGRELNRSGEFLPFKGGVMISYKLN